jgi:hypothetical protein
MSTREAARSILIWSYERGTLQYDIICGLILAFVFFVPPSWLNSKRANPAAANPQVSDTVGKAAGATPGPALEQRGRN